MEKDLHKLFPLCIDEPTGRLKYCFHILLRYFREREDMRLVALAEIVGKDRSFLQRLEYGPEHKLGRGPSRETVLQLADALRLDNTEVELFLLSAQYAPLYKSSIHFFSQDENS